MKKLLLPVLALAAVVIVSSCGKYEEGPSFTLLSKKSRAANTWTLETVLDSSGTDVTSAWLGDSTTWIMEIKKDDTYELRYSMTYYGITYGDTITGTWAFSDDKMELVTTPDDTTMYGGASSATILKLASDELWVEDEDGYEMHFMEAAE